MVVTGGGYINLLIYNTTFSEKESLESLIKKNVYLKVENRNSRKKCEICTKLIIKTPERRH